MKVLVSLVFAVLIVPQVWAGAMAAAQAKGQAKPRPGAAIEVQEAPPQPHQSPYEKVAREFLADFTAGRYEEASKNFSDAMKAIVTPQVMAGVKQKLDSAAGAFQSVTAVHMRSKEGLQNVELMAQYERSLVSLRVAFDRNGAVDSLFLSPVPAERVDPILERIARELLTNLTAGHFDAVDLAFSDTMRRELPSPRIEELAAKVAKTFGRYFAVTKVRQRTEGANRFVDLTAAFEKGQVTVAVGFNDQSLITGLLITPAGK